MTIGQLAHELGVTRQAINSRLHRAGITFEDVASGRSGKAWIITDEGAALIRDIMSGEGNENIDQRKQQTAQETAKQEQAGQEAIQEQLRQLHQELQQLKEQHEQDARTIEQQAVQLEASARTIDRQSAQLEANTSVIEQQAGIMETLRGTIDGLNKTIQAQAIVIAAQTKRIEAAQPAQVKSEVVQVAEQPTAQEQGQAAQPGQQEASAAQPGQQEEAAQPAASKPGLWAWLVSRISGKG